MSSNQRVRTTRGRLHLLIVAIYEAIRHPLTTSQIRHGGRDG